MDLVQTLQGVGFTLYESRAISACLEFGEEATATEIANRAGIPITKVYSVLKALENRGVLSSGLERPKRYSCLGLAELKEKLVEEKKREQEKILRVLESSGKRKRSQSGQTSIFWGKGELKKRLYENAGSKGKVNILFSPEESEKEVVKPYVLRNSGKKARREGNVRILLFSESVEKAFPESLACMLHAKVRVTGSRATSMLVTNEKAVIGLQDLEGNLIGCIETTDQEMVAELAGYYDLLWEQSTPLNAEEILNRRRSAFARA